MQINNVTPQRNTSFGLLYTFFLSSKHQKLIKPIFPKLSKIGKHVDIQISTGFAPCEKGRDYIISTECIEISSRPKENSKTIGKRVTERIFSGDLIGKTEAEQKRIRERILSTAYEVAKESLRPLTINA